MKYTQGHDTDNPLTINESQPFAREGYRLMGAVFEVYNEQGFGLAEEIYQESLEIELEARSIPYKPKAAIDCFYKDRLLQKKYIPDLRVHERLMVELKAVTELTEEHTGQLINYLRLTRSPVGYLVNFGRSGGVEWKRFILSEYLKVSDR